jgi:imidazolonepropionase-like amidohydrolase
MVRSFVGLGLATGLLVLAAAIPISADQTSTPQEALRSHPPNVFALTGAKVVVSPETTLESATVVVRDGKIEAVGDVPVPADAKEISLTGKTIYPGFIDAYSEQPVISDRLTGTARYWNGQVTPQLSVADQIAANPDLSVLRKQGIVAQLVAPADGVIRGTSAMVSTGGGEPNSTLIARDVAQHVLLTLNRRTRSGYPGSPMGAVAVARQALYDAQWYRDAKAAVAADPALPAPEQNDALAALQPVLSGAMPVIVSTSNEQFALRADRFASEFGLSVILKGSGSEYRRLSEIAETKRAVILPLAFPRAPNVTTPESAQDITLETLLHWDIAPENPARVDAAGIRFALSTDRLESRGDFLKSLRKSVERGLSPTSALKALTVTPAELFGLSSQLGTVQPGRLASLVITDGDLFDKKTKVVETWVSGVRFEHSPAKARTPEGQYELQLQPVAQFPTTLFMEITETDGKLKGRISRQRIAKAAQKSSETGKDKPLKDGDAKELTDTPGEGKPAAATQADASTTDPIASPDAVATQDAVEDKSETAGAGGKSAEKKKEVLDLTDVKLNDTLLSARFAGKDWGLEGTVRISITLTEVSSAASDRPVGVGSILWGDGSSASLTAIRVTTDDTGADTAKPDAATPDATKPDATKPANAKPDTKSPELDPATVAETVTEASMAPGTAAERKTADADKKSKPATYAVNYPLGAFGRAEIPAASKLTAFVHATIWTCGPLGVIKDGTLVVADGRIVDVGSNISVPKDAEVIDVRGMHITPGIIDCHSHMATDGGVNEGTQAITCEVRIGDFVDANDITIYRQLAGGVTAANVLHGSANPIGGQNQVIKLRWGLSGEGLKFREAPQGVKFALGENVKQSNWTDATGRYPQTRMGVEQLYRDAFEAARDYARRMDTWKDNRRGLPPRRDLELDALREILEGDRWIHCHSYRQDEILALLRILQEYQITIGTFQHILEGYKVADEMAKAGAMASAFSDWWAYKFEVYDAIPHAGALMHKQGVVVSFNSDDGELARHLNQEAAKAVKYGGVPREDALKFVTLNPAKQLRIDKYVGSLEAEKHADFVVWSGDPLSNFSRCEQTWIDGRRYFHRDDDEQMQSESAKRRNTLIQKILESGEEMREPGERDPNPSELWPRVDEYCHHFSHQRALKAEQKQAE